MSNETETKAAEPTPTPEPEPAKAAERFKDDRAYKAMAKQIEDLRAAESARKSAERDAQAEAERKRAESKSEYEKAKAILQGKIDELEQTIAQKDQAIEAERIQSQLAAAMEGADEYFRQVKIAEYMAADERKPVAEYVAALREAEPDRFEQKPRAPKSAGHSGAVSAAASGSLDERLKSSDPAVAKAAREEYLANVEIVRD